MARVGYPDVGDNDPNRHLAAERVRAQREGRLPNLHRMLLHNAHVAMGWLYLGTAQRRYSLLPPHLRELVICLVGSETRCAYVLASHVPAARRAGALAEQIDALTAWRSSQHFNPQERSTLRFADDVIHDRRIPEPNLTEVQAYFGESEVVDLTAMVSYYVGVTRFLKALEIEPSSDDPPDAGALTGSDPSGTGLDQTPGQTPGETS